MKQEIGLVKDKLYHESVKKKQTPVYDPESFRELCISAGAATVFDTILNTISSPRHSNERINLNKKRAMTIILNMCYSLSQVCNRFQHDHALYLKTSNINQEAIGTEYILGNTCSRRTVDLRLNQLTESRSACLESFINDAIHNKWLLVLVIDDYTSIHTKRRPEDQTVSEAKSMCTMIVKAFKQIPAIESNNVNSIHDSNGVDIESCINVITSPSTMHNLSNSYATIMPHWIRTAFFNQELQRQRLNAHRYCDNDNVRKMRKMDDLHLIDFFQLELKSKNDFAAAYDIILNTGMAEYMKQFVVIQPGDWPCQFYCRQIIYESLQKLGMSNHLHRYRPSDDHCYCQQSDDVSNNIQDNNSSTAVLDQTPCFSSNAILSVVPTIGPLHISLNSREQIVSTFHPFLNKSTSKYFHVVSLQIIQNLGE